MPTGDGKGIAHQMRKSKTFLTWLVFKRRGNFGNAWLVNVRIAHLMIAYWGQS